MYGNRFNANFNDPQLRRRWRVLVIACLVLLCATIGLGIAVTRTSIYQNRARHEIRQQMLNAVASAVDECNRLSSGVSSNTYARLARVRQFVYHAEQVNAMSMILSGSSGRLAPDEAFAALYDDLNAYESVTQTATSSALDIRAQLMAHLTALQAWLDAE